MVKSREFFVRTGKSPKIIHIGANCSHKGAIGHMKKTRRPVSRCLLVFYYKGINLYRRICI